MPGLSALPIASLPDVLDKIVALSEEDFLKLLKAISTKRSFSPSEDDVKKLGRDISLPELDVWGVLSFLKFLYDRYGLDAFADVELSAFLKSVITEAEYAEDDQDRRDLAHERLGTLLQRTELHDRYEKINRLERGFLPSAVSFQSFVDLRPDFDEAGNEILGLIPVVTFRVSTNATDPSAKNMIFHIASDKVDALYECVERLQVKLKKIEEHTK